MRADAIIQADSEFNSAFFLKIKIHISEMADFVTLYAQN